MPESTAKRIHATVIVDGKAYIAGSKVGDGAGEIPEGAYAKITNPRVLGKAKATPETGGVAGPVGDPTPDDRLATLSADVDALKRDELDELAGLLSVDVPSGANKPDVLKAVKGALRARNG